MSSVFFLTITTAAKFIGAGLALIVFVSAGAGIGIGKIFMVLIFIIFIFDLINWFFKMNLSYFYVGSSGNEFFYGIHYVYIYGLGGFYLLYEDLMRVLNEGGS